VLLSPQTEQRPGHGHRLPNSLMLAPLLLPCYSWLAPPLPLPCPSRVLAFLHAICYCLAAGGCYLPCCAAAFPCCLALLACCAVALLACLLRCLLHCLAAACLLHAISCLPLPGLVLVIKRQEWSCSSWPCSVCTAPFPDSKEQPVATTIEAQSHVSARGRQVFDEMAKRDVVPGTPSLLSTC
jgi:hypothetical protein